MPFAGVEGAEEAVVAGVKVEAKDPANNVAELLLVEDVFALLVCVVGVTEG